MSGFMVVDAVQLKKAPLGFREYVTQYFKPTIMMGKKVMVALLHDTWTYEDHREAVVEKGKAPAKFNDVAPFRQGLEGMDLPQWMARNEGRYFWRY
jgi:hypothetical protein